MKKQYIIFGIPVGITLLGIFFFALAQLPKELPSAKTQTSNNKNSDIKSQEKIVVNELSPSIGPVDAKVTVVEFLDFQCPYSRESEEPLKTTIKKYENSSVRFIFRQLPIFTIHPYALQAANATMCAEEQHKYFEMHDLIFTNQEQLEPASFTQFAQELSLDLVSFNTCLAEKKYQPIIEKDLEDAQSLQITGTPTWFINGERIIGAVTTDTLGSAIDKYLEKTR